MVSGMRGNRREVIGLYDQGMSVLALTRLSRNERDRCSGIRGNRLVLERARSERQPRAAPDC
jgi:hypothetical protein